MVIPMDMGSEIDVRLTSVHAVSGGMLMCSRHNDGCMVWRVHKQHGHLYACMHVCMHVYIRCASCASKVDLPQWQAAEACHVQYRRDTCLHRAAGGGHIEVVKYLCEVGGKDLIMWFSEVRCDAMCVLVSC
jgi:hypothetical protein